MGGARGKSIGLLVPGILFLLAGVVVLVAHPGAGIALFALRFWPIFLLLAGITRIAGFALGRRPRSPVGGAILVALGALFLFGSLSSDLTPIQIYARYWLALLAIVAGVYLVRYYSHQPQDGPQPRLFGPVGAVLVILIVSSGIAAHRVSIKNPDLFSAANLPALLHGLPPGAMPRSFSFTDSGFVASDPTATPTITITNTFGDVRVTGGAPGVQARLTKTLRGWDEADAERAAEHIKLVVNRGSEGGRDTFNITATSDQTDYQFTADLIVQAPDLTSLSISESNGTLSASRISGPVSLTAQAAQVEINTVKGPVSMSLQSSDVQASGVDGDLKITGARHVKASDVGGSLDLTANKGDIDLHNVGGKVIVNAPLCHIKAQNLAADSDMRSNHGSIDVSRSAGVSVDAPETEVRVDSITGNLSISTSDSAISVHSVTGNLGIMATRTSVTADGVQGGIDVATSELPVIIRNFGQGVKVRASYDPVTVVSNGQLAGDIDVETSNADIKLALPSFSSFQFEGDSEGGRVRSKGFLLVPLNELSQHLLGAPDHLAFAQGFGGPKIVLKTSKRDIVVEGRSNSARTSQVGPDSPRAN